MRASFGARRSSISAKARQSGKRTLLALPRAMIHALPSLMTVPEGIRLIRFVSGPSALVTRVSSIMLLHPVRGGDASPKTDYNRVLGRTREVRFR